MGDRFHRLVSCGFPWLYVLVLSCPDRCLAVKPSYLPEECYAPLGMEDGSIQDFAITASSVWGDNSHYSSHDASRSRLNTLHEVKSSSTLVGAWVAKYKDEHQWLQIDLGTALKAVTKIATQGRNSYPHDQWVETYTVSYSNDRVHWKTYRHQNNTKVFGANSDKDTVVANSLVPPILGRYVRIHPKAWKDHISMRTELYGCTWYKGNALPLGMENGQIPDSAISASSHSGLLEPWQSRPKGSHAWAASVNDPNQWLQIDLGVVKSVTKVATQGRTDIDQWVQTYTVSFSENRNNWTAYVDENYQQVFSGNSDRDTLVTHDLSPPIHARYIRFHPKTSHGWVAMRAELYGTSCDKGSSQPVGMENSRIPDSAITASSSYINHPPSYSRLKGNNAWAVGADDQNPWLQIDLGVTKRVSKVATQGRQNYNQWVLTYSLSYSENGNDWTHYGSGTPKVFSGNTDRNTVVTHELLPHIHARYVRFHPKDFKDHRSMRVEVFGFSFDCSHTTFDYDLLFPKDDSIGYALLHRPHWNLTEMSACLWFNTTTDNRAHVHIEVINNQTGDSELFLMTTSEGGDNSVYISVKGTAPNTKSPMHRNLHKGTWHHMCVTWDGLDGKVQVFLNGNRTNTLTNSSWAGSIQGNLSVLIGDDKTLLKENTAVRQKRFQGQMSRINIWSYTLNESDFLEMASTCQLFKEGNVLPWRDIKKHLKGSALAQEPSTCPLGRGRDCLELLQRGYQSDGYYLINPDNSTDGYMNVFCDQHTNGGGFEVLHRRYDGSVSFWRTHDEYKYGFGNANGEFWLGLENMHRISSKYQDLLVELEDLGNTAYAFYSGVQISSGPWYHMFLSRSYFGTAGDSMSGINGHPFRTYDRNPSSCLSTYRNPGWVNYNYCSISSNLLGYHSARYETSTYYQGIYWNTWKGNYYSLKGASMKFRRHTGRNQNYALSFSGNSSSDYVLYDRVKGSWKFFQFCVFIKSSVTARRQGIFGMIDDSGVITSFSFVSGSTFYLDLHGNVYELEVTTLTTPAIDELKWSRICLTWGLYGTAVRAYLYVDGVQRASKDYGNYPAYSTFGVKDGALMIGQVPGPDGLPVPGTSLEGQITLFYIGPDMPNIRTTAARCLSHFGLVSWFDAHLWTHGNVTQQPVYLCDSAKVKHRWRLALNGSGEIQDISSTTPKAVIARQVSTDLNSIAIDTQGYVSLGEYGNTCVKKNGYCLDGETVSFWMRFRENFPSRILDNRPQEVDHLNRWLKSLMAEESMWKLCYRYTKHGRDPSLFHSQCDTESSTLVLVETNGNIFGGLLDVPWKAHSPDGHVESVLAFLFSLRNPQGCSPFKLDIRSDMRTKAAYYHPSSGPVFGLNDLHLGPASFADLGHVYNLSGVACGDLSPTTSSQDAQKLFTGSKYFIPDEIEVFYYAANLNPPSSDNIIRANQMFSDVNGRQEYTLHENSLATDPAVYLRISCCSSSCVKTFYLQFSSDNINFTPYPDNGREKLFRHWGTTSGESANYIRHDLLPPIRAKYIKFIAKECFPSSTTCCLNIKAVKNRGSTTSVIISSGYENALVKTGFTFLYKKTRDTSGHYSLMIQNSTHQWLLDATAQEPLTRWTHVVFTWTWYDLSLYMNGILVSDNYRLSKSSYHSGNSYLRVGADTSSTAYDWNKALPHLRIKDLRIWDNYFSYGDLQAISDVEFYQDIFRPSATEDLARNKPAESNSVNYANVANNAIQGSRLFTTTGTYTYNAPNTWWRVNLQSSYLVLDVFVVFKDARDVSVYVKKESTQDGVTCGGVRMLDFIASQRYYCKPAAEGKYVELRQTTTNNHQLWFYTVEVTGLRPPGYVFVNSSPHPMKVDGKVRYRTSFVLPTRTCLSFYYRMNGSYPGRLNVYSSGYQGRERLLWRVAGYYGNVSRGVWQLGRVAIKEDIIYQVIFEAVDGKRYDGEIAFDNITLSNRSDCPLFPMDTKRTLSGIQSRMIEHLPKYRDSLESMLSTSGFGQRYWVRCYGALEQGWNASVLHRNCDNKKPLLVLIRKGSYLFGAFTENGLLADHSQDFDWAYKRPATQSSDHNAVGNLAWSAVDESGTTTSHTANHDHNPWLRVDLMAEVLVYKIFIRNRPDCCPERLHDFEIRIGSSVDHVTNPRCGGLHNMSALQTAFFDCDPAIRGRYVSISKNTTFLSIGQLKVFAFSPIPSTNAFLYSIRGQNVENAKLDVRAGEENFAAFYDPGSLVFGSIDLLISIDNHSVTATPGASYDPLPSNQTFSGEDSIFANDVEVLFPGDTLCDPPCLEGEYCDEMLGMCICDDTRRDVEWCQQRRELQNKRDDYCTSLCGSLSISRCFARFDVKNNEQTKKWRCYVRDALTDDRQRYNTTKNSVSFYTRDPDLKVLGQDYPELVIDSLTCEALLYWPADSETDFKEMNSVGTWSDGVSAMTVRGIRGNAVAFNGSGEPLVLLTNQHIPDCLQYPGVCSPGLTISLWIKFRSVKSQFFLSSMTGTADRGFRIYQLPLGTPNIAVSMKKNRIEFVKVFSAPSGIWTYVVMTYTPLNNDEGVLQAYRDGGLVTEFLSNTQTRGTFSEVPTSSLTLGEVGTSPLDASIDEIMIFFRLLEAKEITDMYNYYKGGSNLQTLSTFYMSDPWEEDYNDMNSDKAKDMSRRMHDKVTEAYSSGESSVQRSKVTRFWNVNGHVALEYLVSYNSTGFSALEPWLKKTADDNVHHVANDVYITPLNITARNLTGLHSVLLNITWQNASRDLLHGILYGYQVFYTNSSLNATRMLRTDNGEGSLTLELTGLKSATEYGVKVRANTMEGEGKWSNLVYAHTDDGPPRSPPGQSRGNAVNSTSIRLEWESITDANLEGPLSHLEIWHQRTSQETHNITKLPPRVLNFTFANLEKFTKYSFKVRGVSGFGKLGPYSALIIVTTQQDAPSAPPINIRANGTNSTVINIDWDPPPAHYHHGIILGYKVRYATVEGNDFTNMSVLSCPTFAELTELRKFTNYSVQVAALTIKGLGPFSDPVFVRTAPDVPSGSPTITSGYNTSSTSLFVSWTSIPNNETNGILLGYAVQYGVRNKSVQRSDMVCAEKLSINLTLLDKQEEYSIRVAGLTSVGIGPFSEPFYVTTDSDIPEGTISNLSVSGFPGPTSVQFSLQPLSHEQANGEIMGYRIYVFDRLRNETFNLTVNASSTHTLRDLFPYTDYEVRIAAFTSKGEGNMSEPFPVKTAESAPSQPPQDVSPQNSSSSSLVVTWVAIHPFFLNGKLRGYIVIYWETLFPETTRKNVTIWLSVSRRRRRAVTSGDSSLEITGLKKYTQYSVQVLAVTVANGVPSIAFNVTTGEDVPDSPPSNVSAHNLSSTSIQVLWAPVPQEYRNGILRGYKVQYKRVGKTEAVQNITISDATQLSTVISGLKKYGEYEISMLAFTVIGEGNGSVPVYTRTAEDIPDSFPVNITSLETSSTEVTLNWLAMSAEHENGIILGYRVRVYEMSGALKKNHTAPGGTRSTVVGSLDVWTNYTVSMAAYTSVGDGPWSSLQLVTTGDEVPDSPPSNVSAHNLSSTSIQVLWAPVPQAYPKFIVRGYKVRYKRVGTTGVAQNITISDATRLSTVISSLKKYGEYEIRILAFSRVGDGNLSALVNTRTAEDIPDSFPVNITSLGTSSTEVTLNWLAMSAEHENGIILGYRVRVYEMSGALKKNHTAPGGTRSTVVGGLDVWTNYTVSMNAYSSVGDGPWSSPQLITTGDEAPRVAPTNVIASFVNSTYIRVQWNSVNASITRGIHRGYRVYYRASNTPFTIILLSVTVGAAQTEAVLVDLYKYVRYSIYVVAMTTLEGVRSPVITERTDQDIPDRPPSHIAFALPTPYAIVVSWDPVPFGYTNGIILGYKITCSTGYMTDVRSLFPDSSLVRFDGLRSYQLHNVTVRAYTVKGEGAVYRQEIMTDENNPCLSPQHLRADNHTSTHSLPVLWGPIPSYCVLGILLGYRVRYTPLTTGEIKISSARATELLVGPNTLSIVLTGLQIFTYYRIEVAGYTSKGEGPFAVTFGETCRCEKRLSTNWMEFAPYVSYNDSKLGGIIPDILENMTIYCCQTCKSHGQSYVDFRLDGSGKSSQRLLPAALRATIDGSTDFTFPIAGYYLQDMYKSVHAYAGIIQTPGVAFVLALTQTGKKTSEIVMRAVTDNWPLILVCYLSAYIMGCIIWYLDSDNDEFPRSFISGSWEGFWWSFVSMTTVGYGDRSPNSVLSRLVAIAWTLTGVVIIGILVGSIATSLSTITISQSGSLYGMRVAAMANSYEYRFGQRRNAEVDVGRTYNSYDEVYKDMVSGYVGGALLDSLGVGSRKDLFEKPFIRVHKVYDVAFVRGVVMSSDAFALKRCFHKYITANAQDISNIAKKMAVSLEVPNEPLAKELSSNLFQADSQLFINAILSVSCAFVLAVALGLIWELMFRRTQRKIANDETQMCKYKRNLREEMLVELKEFRDSATLMLKRLQDKHKQEKRRYFEMMRTIRRQEEAERRKHEARRLPFGLNAKKYEMDEPPSEKNESHA